MRILIMFDLPMITKTEKRHYTLFRKQLLELGFYMLQFSIYVKITDNHEDAKRKLKQVEVCLPPQGQIRALVITDKQYQKMKVLLGESLLWEEDHDEPDKTIVI